MNNPAYKRILLKLSGEILAGNKGYGIDPDVLENICNKIIKLKDSGIQIGIVIGGGNIFRGISAAARGMDRVAGDYLGMMDTIMNSVGLHSGLEKLDCDTRVMSEFVKKGLNNDEHISLLDEGSALRRYLHITDFCKILLNITLKGKNNLYNIGGIEEISIYQMANIIADRFNKTVKIGTTINKVSSSAPKKVWVSMNRYLQEFDSLIFKPFGEGLNEFIDWYSKKINN